MGLVDKFCNTVSDIMLFLSILLVGCSVALGIIGFLLEVSFYRWERKQNFKALSRVPRVVTSVSDLKKQLFREQVAEETDRMKRWVTRS